MTSGTVDVLCIEDDPADADVAHSALRDVGCQSFRPNVWEYREAALTYLSESRKRDATEGGRPR